MDAPGWVLSYDRAGTLCGDLALPALSQCGVPVPDGFVVRPGADPERLEDELRAAVAELERRTGRSFSDPESPLLLAVRGRTTVLNVGLNAATEAALSAKHGERFALDCRRHFLATYGRAVLGLNHRPSSSSSDALTDGGLDRPADRPPDASELGALNAELLETILSQAGESIPADPWFQLKDAIRVLSQNLAESVTVSEMIFGNQDRQSGIGTVCTHDPTNGARRFFGEYLACALGGDLDLGFRRALPFAGPGASTFEAIAPTLAAEVRTLAESLGERFRDMLEIRFAVQHGDLRVVEVRRAARTPLAAVQVATGLVSEGVLEPEEALSRVPRDVVQRLLGPRRPLPRDASRVGKGVPASPGGATGRVFLIPAKPGAAPTPGDILVAMETEAVHVPAMSASAGLLTGIGGVTSHAAIVSRALGKPCIVSIPGLSIDLGSRKVRFGDRVVPEGARISIDGSSGVVVVKDDTSPQPCSETEAPVRAWLEGRTGVDPNDVIAGLDAVIESRAAARDGERPTHAAS